MVSKGPRKVASERNDTKAKELVRKERAQSCEFVR